MISHIYRNSVKSTGSRDSLTGLSYVQILPPGLSYVQILLPELIVRSDIQPELIVCSDIQPELVHVQICSTESNKTRIGFHECSSIFYTGASLNDKQSAYILPELIARSDSL